VVCDDSGGEGSVGWNKGNVEVRSKCRSSEDLQLAVGLGEEYSNAP
jgi:hypothetical protein